MMRGLRPATGRESYAPGIGAGGGPSSGAYGPPCRACVLLEELMAAQPEAKATFLGEGGVLVLLEVLDTDNEKVGAGQGGGDRSGGKGNWWGGDGAVPPAEHSGRARLPPPSPC